jgi:hypothetical protein
MQQKIKRVHDQSIYQYYIFLSGPKWKTLEVHEMQKKIN